MSRKTTFSIYYTMRSIQRLKMKVYTGIRINLSPTSNIDGVQFLQGSCVPDHDGGVHTSVESVLFDRECPDPVTQLLQYTGLGQVLYVPHLQDGLGWGLAT